MKQELQESLYQEFPTIFRQAIEKEPKSCMYYGLCIGNGWYNLIRTLCFQIKARVDAVDSQIKHGYLPSENKITIEAAQVKAKFGGLRFYVDGGDDFIRGAIALAESMSYQTCEVCGNFGRHDKNNVLCQDHKSINYLD